MGIGDQDIGVLGYSFIGLLVYLFIGGMAVGIKPCVYVVGMLVKPDADWL